MSGIKSTLTHFRRLRSRFETLLADAKEAQVETEVPSPALSDPPALEDVQPSGSNPGNLGMKVYVPSKPGRRPALVVVLHGCDQTAAGYDRGSGWSTLAERHGFVLLYPEQRASNNGKNCFSWFLAGDVTRGAGEVMSIAQMVEQVASEHRVDRARVFVSGLSAGGAMTSALLATYPEVFSAGAIIAGLPYGSARSVQEAFECMFGDRVTAPDVLGARVRSASEHQGAWPLVSIWHGTEDTVVRASNGEELVRQWTNVHGLPVEASGTEMAGAHRRRRWLDRRRRVVVEHYALAGMGHGVPVAVSEGPRACGARAPFFLDIGISSTEQIASHWGLLDKSALSDAAEWSELVDEASQFTPAMTSASGKKHLETARAAAPSLAAASLSSSEGLSASESSIGFDPIDPFGFIDAAMRVAGLK